MITKKFIRNSIIYTIAGSLPMASAIILLPFYLGYLSPDTFGALSIYMSISLLVQIFVTFSFDTSVYINFHEYKREELKLNLFLSSVFIFILILGIITSIFFSITGEYFFDLFFNNSRIRFFPYGLMAVLTGTFQGLFKVNSSLLQTQERASEFLRQNVILFLLTALLTIIGLKFFPDDLLGPLGGRLLAFVISVGWVFFTIAKRYGLRFDFALLKRTFGFNRPMLVYQILQWFNSYFDRVLMTVYLPLSQIGVYDLASKCLMGIEFVITGFNNSFYPKVIGIVSLQKVKQTTIEINRYYNGITAVAILMVVISILGLPIVIELMVQWFDKPGYLLTLPLLPLIAVVYLLRSLRLFMAMPYAAVKYTQPLPVYYVFIISVKLGSMIWLIQLYGLLGAVAALLIGYATEVIVLFLGIRNKFSFNFNVHKLVTVPLCLGALIMIIEPWQGKSYPLLVHTLYLAFGIILLVWTYRRELKQLDFSKILKR